MLSSSVLNVVDSMYNQHAKWLGKAKVSGREGYAFRAAIFDMDGVVTRTADLHAAAWKELFDAYLEERLGRGQPGFTPFDIESDYRAYVDGKPRYEGVRSFLATRGITLPYGEPADEPAQETIRGLGNRKDEFFERRLRAGGAQHYGSTVALIQTLRANGIRTALVTSSRHGREVLQIAGVTELFDTILDGTDADRLELQGKPNPDIFLKAAERLEIPARRCIVVEDAVSGVEAGRRGGFGLVIGVDRGGNRTALMEHGADFVVDDLDELDLAALDAQFLQHLAMRRRKEAAMLEDEAWRVEQEGFDPAREHAMESIYTVGNGYLGVRGALDRPLPGSQADLFVAGIYDRKQSTLPYSELEFLAQERDDPYSEIVSLPFPFRVEIRVDGMPLEMSEGRWHEHRRTLDLKRGVLRGHYRFKDEHGGRTAVDAWRCASLSDLHLLMQEVQVTCEDHDAIVELDASIDEAELALDHPHLQPRPVKAPDGVEVRVYETKASGYRVALATRVCVSAEAGERTYWQLEAKAGVPLKLRRYACIYTSRDVSDPVAAAISAVREKRWEDFAIGLTAHEAEWARFWAVADIRTENAAAAAQALRFNAYHLRIAADHDPKVSVTARTLSGRAYEGHIFWDVEVFMLPFFLHTRPDIARSLLLYRHHTLPGARERARELGYRGACYAWESTVTGADTTPREIVLKTTGRKIPIYTGYEQVHVTADVAYGVARYFEATQDQAFMRDAGAEILLDSARFWASRCVKGTHHYHLRAVIGPDEYHHTVNDNAYTNWMARLNLEHALWAARWLAQQFPERSDELRAQLALDAAEIESWEEIARTLYFPEPNKDGVIEQFEGFFDLAAYRLPQAERFRPPLERLFNAEEINASQLIKQADVLMLFFLFPERFPRNLLDANYRYYEPRTDHGSSLSPPVHAALAARLGRTDEAWRYFRRALWLDLENAMGNSTLGVHPASMAGTWQTLVFGFLGVRFENGVPITDPEAAAHLPPEWRAVDLSLVYRDKTHSLRIRGTEENT